MNILSNELAWPILTIENCKCLTDTEQFLLLFRKSIKNANTSLMWMVLTQIGGKGWSFYPVELTGNDTCFAFITVLK